MPRLPKWSAATFLVLAVTAAVHGGLRENIDMIVRQSDLGGAEVSVSVRRAGPGTVECDLEAERPMIPASNLKLLTTGAALHQLGADFRFKTRLLIDGANLTLVGDGDPAFGDPELLALMPSDDGAGMDVESFLRLWIDAVVATGLPRIERLTVDDRIFDRQFVHESWPVDQLNRRYCAEVSGFSFHLNQLHFFPEPRPGKRPSLGRLEPASGVLVIRNNATSRQGPHDDDTVWIARRRGTNQLTFYGNVKHRYRDPVPVTAHDMPALFGEILAERLRRTGVEVGSVAVASADEDAAVGTTVGPAVSTPIGTAVTRCNRDSQNLYAESLLKRIGHAATGQPGSWLNGAAIVRRIVHERLENPDLSSRVIIADGSGLSRLNRIAPATLTAWLNSFNNDDALGAIFIDSLAVGGESGTLERRLASESVEGAVVQAKSGYINGVSCLSGYVTISGGRRSCFSIMVNDLDRPVRNAKRMQDSVVGAIAEHLMATPVALGSD